VTLPLFQVYAAVLLAGLTLRAIDEARAAYARRRFEQIMRAEAKHYTDEMRRMVGVREELRKEELAEERGRMVGKARSN
jgi:hypothetical protein